MNVSIPARAIVNVVPNLVAAGGTGLNLGGLVLTSSTRVPVGVTMTFPNVQAVANFFGVGSPEAAFATRYFQGYDGAPVQPAQLTFIQYATEAVPAYVRGATFVLSLAQLQAVAGKLTITVSGETVQSGAIDLTGTASPSAAAATITAALANGMVVTFDPVAQAFVITTDLAGAAATITAAENGPVATALGLTAATGAVLSQGADAMTPAQVMASAVASTQNFATFGALDELDADTDVAFATWANETPGRFLFVLHDSDPANLDPEAATAAVDRITAAELGGVFPLYAAQGGAYLAAAVMGAAASIPYGEAGGRTNLAFLSQAGLLPSVTSEDVANVLLGKGVNFYGAYATAAQGFVFFYPGSVTGKFAWADTYLNEIWLTNALQLDLMELLTRVRSIPYTPDGFALIEQALSDTIAEAISFGAIRAGVTLSALQAAEVNAAAGRAIDGTITDRGWYLQVTAPTADVRAARGSPITALWYADGESVQQINLNSNTIQ